MCLVDCFIHLQMINPSFYIFLVHFWIKFSALIGLLYSIIVRNAVFLECSCKKFNSFLFKFDYLFDQAHLEANKYL